MSDPSTLPCYLNGDYTPIGEAKISVLDRGFIFGDGVYEVIPVYAGHPFRLVEHLARLDRSLAEMRIANPRTPDEWRTIAMRLVAMHAEANGVTPQGANYMVYIQVTRGVAPRDHVMPKNITPTVFMMVNPMSLPSDALRKSGVACVTADDFRWEKAHIKSTSLLGSVFARQISFDSGATETVMFRGDSLSEGASSNVWVVRGNTVYGPPKDNLVLQGIRFGLIEELCREQGLGFELRKISRAEVLGADELLLSSASKEVLPITRLDGKPVGNGAPGPIYEKLYAAYQQAKNRSATAALAA